jgi:F-type H+-transporting ATPase subunit delta
MKISPKQYAQVLYDITDGKSKTEAEKTVADFARYLGKDRKTKLAGKIIEQYAKIYNKEKEIVDVVVSSQKKLTEPETQKIKKFIKGKYDAKEVILENMIDEKIIGGIVVRVGDELMDASMRGKLEELRKILVN